jgi:hypothetical protein
MSDQIKNKIDDISVKDFQIKEGTQSLYKAVKDNPKDRIEVEIGDSKDSSKIYPQAKVMRWNNEVNLSVRYQGKEASEEVVSSKDDKVVWESAKEEVHIYEKPDVGEDGGLELEILLKEKPKSNVFEFSIQTKGLDFFYQPELTEKEKDEGATRPENVVGSYAVYHKEKQGNYPDIEYKTGKFCHIYRPKVTDAKGNEVWGELNIDVDSKLLTVTVDEKWLEKAVYPVIIDPTFGYASVGSSWQNLNFLRGSEFTSGSGIDSVTDIESYVKLDDSGLPSDGIQMGMWTDGGAYVSNSASDEITVNSTSASWKSFEYSFAPSISDSTDYFLCLASTDWTWVSCAYDTGGANQGVVDNTSTNFTATDFSGFETYDTKKYSIYVTYTESAGGTEANSERGLYIKGYSTSNSERGLYIKGKSSGNSERGLYTQGYLTNNSERGLYIEGSVESVYTMENASDLESDDTVLSTNFTEQNYTDVATDDNNFVDLEGVNEYSKFLFKEYNDNASAEVFTVTWKGKSSKAPSGATVYLQVYNRNTSEWENLDTESSASANTEFQLSGSVSSDVANYYDANYLISCRVYQEV